MSPCGVSLSVARTIEAAIATSYVDAFRIAAAICGLLAIGSVLVAWFSLGALNIRDDTV